MSRRTPHQRGKLEFAGAIDDLIAQIELERARGGRPAAENPSSQPRGFPATVTYDTWVATPCGIPRRSPCHPPPASARRRSAPP
jgi:hypothetical protein